MRRGLSREAGANKGGISRVVRIRCFKFFQDTFLVGVMRAPTVYTDREREGQGQSTAWTLDFLKAEQLNYP